MAKEIAVKDAKKTGKAKNPNKKKRRSPARFIKEMWFELKKVTWPTKKDMVSYTITVIVFILIFAALVGGIDWLLANGLNLVIK
ncbi:MAG: preprotein translocase subunit SecE [Christensenellales bacterium]